MDNGQWTMDNGQFTMDNVFFNGQLTMDNGQRFLMDNWATNVKFGIWYRVTQYPIFFSQKEHFYSL
jgi:hypothetical protein